MNQMLPLNLVAYLTPDDPKSLVSFKLILIPLINIWMLGQVPNTHLLSSKIKLPHPCDEGKHFLHKKLLFCLCLILFEVQLLLCIQKKSINKVAHLVTKLLLYNIKPLNLTLGFFLICFVLQEGVWKDLKIRS